jgi:hypothetical protein
LLSGEGKELTPCTKHVTTWRLSPRIASNSSFASYCFSIYLRSCSCGCSMIAWWLPLSMWF